METFLGKIPEVRPGIREDVDTRTISFYIAGYTKTCAGVLVQENHKELFVCQANYPTGVWTPPVTNIILEPDLDNKFDSNAVLVKAKIDPHAGGTALLHNLCQTKVLGYVPRVISSEVKKRISCLSGGRVVKTKQIPKHTKNGDTFTYATRIEFSYDTNQSLRTEDDDRFMLILDDLEDL